MPITTIVVRDESLRLHPEKAVYWPKAKTLFVADLHFGKSDTFRAAGYPVPDDSTAADLDRLGCVITTTQAERLVVLGDLFHDRTGRESQPMLNAVTAWRENHQTLEVLIVRGNHDRRAGDPPPEWQFRTVNEPDFEPPFALRHYPDPTDSYYTLSGHLHPSVSIRGMGRQQLRLPCFWFGHEVGVLPSFGGFTGTCVISPGNGERVVCIADGETILL